MTFDGPCCAGVHYTITFVLSLFQYLPPDMSYISQPTLLDLTGRFAQCGFRFACVSCYEPLHPMITHSRPSCVRDIYFHMIPAIFSHFWWGGIKIKLEKAVIKTKKLTTDQNNLACDKSCYYDFQKLTGQIVQIFSLTKLSSYLF